jgi:hypothetical protein
LLFYLNETFDDVPKAFLEIVAVGGHGDRLRDGLIATDPKEPKIGATAIQGHHNSLVSVQIHRV